jgi:hypothetical protein
VLIYRLLDYYYRIVIVLLSVYSRLLESVLTLLFFQLTKSTQLQISIALAGIAVIPSWLAQVLYSLTPYPYLYLSYDYIRTVALYLHHSWIASFITIL